MVMQDRLRNIDLGSLACFLFGCGSRVGSPVRVSISPLSIYGYAFLGLLVFSMLSCCSDLLDLYPGI